MESDELHGKMSRLYEVFPWSEDRDTVSRRVEEGVSKFRCLLGHEWASHLLSRRRVSIVDAMGGVGVGGIALALALRSEGVESSLTVVDVRRNALERAVEYARSYLGVEASVVEASVEELASHVECPADVILVYGYSTPHLDPYQLARAAANMAYCISDRGLVVVEEHDRIYEILYSVGYKEVLAEEASEDKLVVSYHSGYDAARGMFKRLLVDHYTGEKAIAYVRLWDLAGVAAMLWAFFREIDFHPLGRHIKGFILARSPRRVDPQEYSEYPKAREAWTAWA